MRNALLGMMAGVGLMGLVGAGWVCTSTADAQRLASAPRSEIAQGLVAQGLVALPSDVDDRHQQITLVDPIARTMVVYHIDKPSGEVTLRSVRNIHWDLQMDEFNGKTPLPREIRSLLERR
jgi:hypothetical protein